MRAKKTKTIKARTIATGSPREVKADPSGYGARQHQDVVPTCGQGPMGNCGAIVPWGATPPVPPPPVGAGKGFKGI